MMRYRRHRGSLEDSLETECEVDGRAGLIRQLRREFRNWPSLVWKDEDVRIKPYGGNDPRIGWENVHIVTIDGYGVAGFCEGDGTMGKKDITPARTALEKIDQLLRMSEECKLLPDDGPREKFVRTVHWKADLTYDELLAAKVALMGVLR